MSNPKLIKYKRGDGIIRLKNINSIKMEYIFFMIKII